MASTINTTNIDTTYPIAGQDNDSQGFRDNFTNTNTNFVAAKAEIEDLQNKAILKSALTGDSLDNDFGGAIISNAQVQGIRSTVENHGAVTAAEEIDLALAPYHKLIATEPLTLSFIGWSASGTHSAVQVEIDITNVSYTVTLPAEVTIGIDGIQGIAGQVITFAATGTYILGFATTDFGTTVSVHDLTPAASAGSSATPTILDVPESIISIDSTTGTWTTVNNTTLGTAGATAAILRFNLQVGDSASTTSILAEVGVKKTGTGTGSFTAVNKILTAGIQTPDNVASTFLSAHNSVEVTVNLDAGSDFDWYTSVAANTNPFLDIILVGYYV